MQVSVEINDLECSMTVGMPRARVDLEVEKRIKDLARRSKINGFRPGKVPVRVIAQRYGEQVRQEVLGEVTKESFQEALTQEKLRPAGMPSIEFKELETNPEEIAYTAKFELYPEVGEIKLAGISLEKAVSEVTDGDVDEMLHKLRDQRKTWVAVDRPAQTGDQLIIDFTGRLADETEPFPGGSAEAQQLILGSGQFIEGFEAGLSGVVAGEVRDLHLTFPTAYQNAELSGKPVTFNVVVKTVNQPELPVIDEAFIKAFGVADGSMDSLRQEVRNNMERELRQTLKNTLKQRVMDALLVANELKVPQSMVDEEAERLKASMEAEFNSRGIRSEQLNLQAAQFNDRAYRRVKLGILMSELIGQNKLQPDSDKVRATLENLASTYEDPAAVVQWFYSEPKNLREVEASVLEDQAVDWILERVEVTENTLSFTEVMDAQRRQAGT